MGLLRNVLGGLAKSAAVVGKMVKGALKQELQKGKKARRNSMYMSDDELLHAIRNTRHSIGERAGFFQALKDRHKK